MDFHLGDETPALAFARANIQSWLNLRDNGGLDAIVSNAAGCGTQVKDYGYMLRRDPEWKDKAEHVSALTRDISELFGDDGLGQSLNRFQRFRLEMCAGRPRPFLDGFEVVAGGERAPAATENDAADFFDLV